MDSPEAPHQHHAPHTGRPWLDIVLAVSAMFVSVVSLVVAVAHGRTMERMAEANTHMVEANSWPFVEFDSHNVNEKGEPQIRLVLTNQGIGPARIETFELSWNGKPMASPWDLLEACCGTADQSVIYSLGNAAPKILRAGEHENIFSVAPRPGTPVPDLYARLNAERGKFATRICYCSVFDECWVSAGLAAHADRVPSCAAPATPFRTDVLPPETK